MKIIPNKEINAIAVAAIKVGWTVSYGGKHPKLKSPRGRYCVSVSLSPSDSRFGAMAFEKQLRKCERMEQEAA